MRGTRGRYEITGKAKFEMRQDEKASRTQFTFCEDETESEKGTDKEKHFQMVGGEM